VVAWAGTGLDVVMVAQGSPDRFVPIDVPRVAVSGDGSLAAVHESSRVTLLELPSGTAFAEIGVDPEALGSEVAWVGAPPRLLVLSRYDGNSTAHLIDPLGPQTIAEIRLEATMRLAATVGGWALAIGSLGTAVLSSSETHLTAYQFPTRVIPVTAGAAAGQFLVALGGSVEEWDPQSRMPRRRLRLPRSAAITGVGGSERLVWMTTQQEPARIDVIPLVNRGQPKAHDPPEPILRTVGHPRSDLVACLGAETGRLYIVDLDGRTRLRIIDPEGIERIDAVGLVVGRMTGVIVAKAGHPIAVVRLDGRDLEVDGAAAAPTAILPRSGPLRRPDDVDERDVVSGSDVLPTVSSLYDEPPGSAPPSAAPPSVAEEAVAPEPLDDSSSILSPPPPHPSSPDLSPPSLDGSSSDAPSSAGLSTGLSPAPDPSPPPPSSPRFDLSTGKAAASPGLSPPRFDPSSGSAPSSSGPSQSSVDRPAADAPSMAPAVAPTGFRAAPAPPAAPRQPPLPAGKPAPSVSARFSAWRDMVRQNQTHVPPGPSSPPGALFSPGVPPPPVAPPPRAEPSIVSTAPSIGSPAPSIASPAVLPVGPPRDPPRLTWRDDLAAWSQAVGASTADPAAHGQPIAYPIEALLGRFELEPTILPVLALLYGAHLRGEVGVAPIDVARMLDRQWDEALGGGELARTGVCEYVRSRVALSPVILRALDELPPLTGTLLGPPGPVALLGPCVVVAHDEPLEAVAQRCLPQVGGAILVAHTDVPCAPLVFEARAYGAAAMLRIGHPVPTSSSDPVIFVVDDAELGDRLAVPHLA
jgi:hypothetical protein